MSVVEYQKLVVPKTAFGHPAHADFFSLNRVGLDGFPIVIFFGGAINAETYEARKQTRPDNIALAFQSGCEANGVVSAGLLVIPCPYGGQREQRIPGMQDLLINGYLKELQLQPDNIRSFMGNSAGVYLMIGVLPHFYNVMSIISIAGVGFLNAIDEYPRTIWPSMIRCYTNDLDLAGYETACFVSWAISQGVDVTLIEKKGSHAFADYESNGSVRDAFLYATSVLRQ